MYCLVGFWTLIVPIRRFSSTDSEGNTWRPSGTWQMPIRTISWGLVPVISLPLNSIVPPALSTRPEMDISVVLLPAPLAPMRQTISFSSTWKEIPRSAMT